MDDGCDPTDRRSYLRNGHATGAHPSGPDRFRSPTGTAGKYWSTLPKTVPSWPVRRLLSDAAARFYRWTGQHRWLWPDPAANPRSPGPSRHRPAGYHRRWNAPEWWRNRRRLCRLLAARRRKYRHRSEEHTSE